MKCAKVVQKLAILAASSYGLAMLGCGGNLPRLAGNNNNNNAQPTNSNSGNSGKPTPTPTPSASPSPTPFVDNGGGHGGHGRGGGDDGGRGGNDGGKNGSLKSVSIPGPTAAELSNVVLDKSAAIALGKAFFWDMQFGSDGKVACATCHSDAGADNRFVNQINPGQHRVDGNGAPAADSNTFYAPFGPNYTLTAADFPLHKIGGSDSSNVVGSQGMYHNTFNDVIMGQAAE